MKTPASHFDRTRQISVHGPSGLMWQVLLFPLFSVYLSLSYSVEVFFRKNVGVRYIQFEYFIGGIVGLSVFPWIWLLAAVSDLIPDALGLGLLFVIQALPEEWGLVWLLWIASLVMGLLVHRQARTRREQQEQPDHTMYPGESRLLAHWPNISGWKALQLQNLGEPAGVVVFGLLMSVLPDPFGFLGNYTVFAGLAWLIKGWFIYNYERTQRLNLEDAQDHYLGPHTTMHQQHRIGIAPLRTKSQHNHTPPVQADADGEFIATINPAL